MHEGDEGRDDDAGSLAHKRGYLVAEALAATGWHEHNSVVSRAEPLDDLGLVAPEVVVAEDPAEHSLRALEQGP